MATFLEVRNLTVQFISEGKAVTVVDQVSLHADQGEILCIVGESGCGKSVTALSIMRLLQTDTGRCQGGQILFEGEDLQTKTEKEMQSIRGNAIAMIYQEPMTALNPVFTIGSQLVEAILAHKKMTRVQAVERAERLLSQVGIPDAGRRLEEYPHQLSGGMCQRAMIAMALSCEPKLLIADEPTTALDVTIQAQILDLVKRLQQEMGMTIIFITHDLGVVAEVADRVVVMYAGKVVEEGNTSDVLTSPLHPYTRGLLNSIPRPGHVGKLSTIDGMVPHGANLPAGCRFHTRCPEVQERCRQEEPLSIHSGNQKVACFLYVSDCGRGVK